MTGHGCGCGRSSCNVCSHSHHNHHSSWGKDVYYGNDNLRRFFVSCGENFDAIIEKAFNYAADIKELLLEFEQETLEKFTAFTVELNAIKIRLAALEAAGGGTVDLTDILADIAALQGQMTTVINNIGTLSNLTTTTKTNLVAAINEIDADLTTLSTKIGDLSTLTTTNKTSVVNAINEVNAKVPVLGTLNNLPGVVTQATNFTDAINDRQPVWKKPTTITVGASQTTPFNNLETAIEELKKYHFPEGRIILNLESATYTLTKNLIVEENLPILTLKSTTGNKADVTIDLKGFLVNVREKGTLRFQDLTITNTVDIANYLTTNSAGSLNLDNVNINTFNHNHTVITAGGTLSRVFYNNLTINTTLDNTKEKTGFYVANTASMVGTNLVINNYATVVIVTSNSQAEMGGVQFTNIYRLAFLTDANSSLMISGNNDFDASDNPTGFENTVNYPNDIGYYVFTSVNNSNLIVSKVRVKNLGVVSNTKRIDDSGNVLSWEASIALVSSYNSNLSAGLCHFDNFTRGINVERNGVVTMAGCKLINLNYYCYGYVGQISHSWTRKQNGTIGWSNVISKNPALTNSTNVGVLDSPFNYSNGFITFTGWSNNAPVEIG
jgi:hypothetical protein